MVYTVLHWRSASVLRSYCHVTEWSTLPVLHCAALTIRVLRSGYCTSVVYTVPAHWRSACCVATARQWSTLYSYYCHYCTGAPRVAYLLHGVVYTVLLLSTATTDSVSDCTGAPRVVRQCSYCRTWSTLHSYSVLSRNPHLGAHRCLRVHRTCQLYF